MDVGQKNLPQIETSCFQGNPSLPFLGTKICGINDSTDKKAGWEPWADLGGRIPTLLQLGQLLLQPQGLPSVLQHFIAQLCVLLREPYHLRPQQHLIQAPVIKSPEVR